MPLSAPLASATHHTSCQRCAAVCCRLTVVLMPEDRIPAHLTTTSPEGLPVMARQADGWCAALDPRRMNCTIYAQRPDTCRRFVMEGAYCRAARKDYQQQQSTAAAPTPAPRGKR